MTDAQAEALAVYFEDLLKQLNLGHWDATLERQHADESNEAQLWIGHEQDTCRLRVSHGFWQLEAERQREILVHEALHPHLDRAASMANDAVEKAAGADGHAIFAEVFMSELERSIDRIARAIAPTFALPEFPR